MRDYSIENVYIELTSKCNLLCSHCYNNSGNGNSRTYELDYGFLKNFLVQCHEKECRTVIFSGGEPLLYPYLFELINFCLQEGYEEVRIASNGILINADVAKKLGQYKKNLAIQVSLDGTNETENDSLRGPGNFKRTLKGIQNLHKNGIEVHINHVLTANRTNHIVDFLNTLYLTGVKKVFFRLLVISGRANETLQGINNLDCLLEFQNVLEDLKEKNPHWPEIIVPEVPFYKCSLLLPDKEELILRPRIDYYGNLYLCQRFKGDNDSFSIGNIHHQTINAMLVSNKYAALTKLLEATRELNSKCNKCLYRLTCFKACPADMLSSGDFFNYTDDFCAERIRKMHKVNAYIT